MKCVISTNVSVGYKNMLHRGTQFKLRYIHAPTDTADEVRDLRKFIGVVAEDARELGYYVSYSPDSAQVQWTEGESVNDFVTTSTLSAAINAE